MGGRGSCRKGGGEGGRRCRVGLFGVGFGFGGWALCRGVCMGVEFGGISIVLCGHL